MKSSKQWAEKLASEDRMQHNPDRKFGENVYCVTSNMKGFKVRILA